MFEIAKRNNNINVGTFYVYRLEIKEYEHHSNTSQHRLDNLLSIL